MKEVFSENPVYVSLALVGTLLYVLKMAMFLFGGEGDLDDADFDDIDGGDNFSLVSTQSILAFLMGTGWIGLAAIREWEFTSMKALFAATGFGFIMMLFSAFITFKIKKFNSIPKYDMKDALGKTGRAYTNIPGNGEGVGQVEITVNNKQQILQARTGGDAIKSFDSVIVTDVDDSGNLTVKKA